MAQRDARPPFAAIDGAVPPEFSALPTPCYLLDEAALTRNAEILGGLAHRTGCKVLLAQKAFSNYDLYPLLASHLAGTEASGLYESQQRVEVEVRERLLRQQDLAAGALLHPQQDLAVAAQLAFVQQVAGGGQGSEGFLRQLRQPREGRAGVSQPHQSTRAGAWLSERGRPYLSSASR